MRLRSLSSLFCAIVFSACWSTAHAQVIKTLGYNTTNGQIVAATNVVWTNAFGFQTNTVAEQVRNNLALGATNSPVFASVGVGSLLIDGTTNVSVDVNDKYLANNSAVSGVAVEWSETNAVRFGMPIAFLTNTHAAVSRTNLGVPLQALTNTSNVAVMRALAGSTNTNQPFSGVFNFQDPDTLGSFAATVSNGIIVSIVEY